MAVALAGKALAAIDSIAELWESVLQQLAPFQPHLAHKRVGHGVPLFIFYRLTIWFG